MSFKNLFNIILKIFGLFFLREIINTLPQLISSVYLYFNGSEGWTIMISLFMSALIIVLYIIIVFQLLFKTNRLIALLKLDQHLDEHDFSFEQKIVFQLIYRVMRY